MVHTAIQQDEQLKVPIGIHVAVSYDMLVTLIASHVQSFQRLASLKVAIASALRETDHVYVSLSHDVQLTDLPTDDRLTIIPNEYHRCSQMHHWITLHARLACAKDIHVVLLDDDDYFNEGARVVFNQHLSPTLMVCCGVHACDPSGCIMHIDTFRHTIFTYLYKKLDPSYPMADVDLLHKSVHVPSTAVTKKPFDPMDSTWFTVVQHHTKFTERGL